ncbi:MAG: dihydrolipoyl dehydrogenase [candidate division Zixibacteria bacterium]|jgi:dihydrolipoamide dehydrogenase|nr:dihydrolipoyl dehydrogenase [candidate division Zixibacteria bacterium]
MVDQKDSTHVAVIGGGPGGYAAAFMAADLGLDVTLVDPEENPGGVCLYRGCIPSKALLHVAKLIAETREAESWGLKFGEVEIDLDKLRSWKDGVVGKLTGGLGQLARARKVTHIRGKARFVSSTTLEIKAADGARRRLTTRYCILATGSRPAVIPNLAPESDRILDSTSALDIKSVPRTLLVVGGGYIGLELGTVYAALGSKVSVVEMTPSLLPGADKDLVSILSKRLKSSFESIMLNSTVAEMKEQKNGIRATFRGDKLEKESAVYEKVLMSVGRKPNSGDLGLENTKVRTDQRGFVIVNERRQTDDPAIFAIGDIAGEPMLAHKASHEGRVVAEVIAGKHVNYDPRAIPAVVFTDPEIAWCGLMEHEAKQKGIDVKVSRFPWAASGRATTLGRNDGVTKIVVDANTDRVLGVGIAGAGAGELIAEAVLAIEMGALASDLGLTIHPHPTLSETIMGAADLIYGHATDYYRPKRA